MFNIDSYSNNYQCLEHWFVCLVVNRLCIKAFAFDLVTSSLRDLALSHSPLDYALIIIINNKVHLYLTSAIFQSIYSMN